LPRCTERVIVERQTKAGGAMFNVTCRVDFDLVSTEDGSKATVCTYGEAMDSADKATNKAMSAAYKYLALLVFCIPTEATADTDADFSTHELASTSMSSKVLTEWLEAIRTCQPHAVAGLVAEGKAAAEEVKDREAWIAIRDAGKIRSEALQAG
ncbi:MAG: hypothetical protein QG619_1432, partial [Pseudomonadota bacterium]|nr:hypothetical protein [Pseudomonadota bacterium]